MSTQVKIWTLSTIWPHHQHAYIQNQASLSLQDTGQNSLSCLDCMFIHKKKHIQPESSF